MKRESLSGLLLIACAILAMAISNSPFGPVYERWLQAPLPAGTHMSLLHWSMTPSWRCSSLSSAPK